MRDKYLYRAADLSSDRHYRYSLSRSWSQDFGAYALWIGLNPSIADELHDDPTVDNMCRRTQYWETAPGTEKKFVGIMLGNIYGWRATDPLRLLHVPDPIGPMNDDHLRSMIERCDMVICAWGNGPFGVRAEPRHLARCRGVVNLIRGAGKTPYMLHKCASGHPRHPLYWPEDAPAHIFPGYRDDTQGKEDGDKSRSTRATGKDSR